MFPPVRLLGLVPYAGISKPQIGHRPDSLMGKGGGVVTVPIATVTLRCVLCVN